MHVCAAYLHLGALVLHLSQSYKPRDKQRDKQRDKVKLLSAKVRRIAFNSERYHSWWIGHEAQDFYHPLELASYSLMTHNHSSPYAIFTSILDSQGSVYHGCPDLEKCLSNYLSSLRSFYIHDIVLAVPKDMNERLKEILLSHQTIIYEIPSSLCKPARTSVSCGTLENQIPGTLFVYYFYEIWALKYTSKSCIMLSEFTKDVRFPANPFQNASSFIDSHQLFLYSEKASIREERVIMKSQKVAPNVFYKRLMEKCYTAFESRNITRRPMLDTANAIGTRDGIVVWTHSITMQLQELLSRVDSLTSAGCLIDHVERVFMQYIVYSKRLRKYMRIKITG